MAQLRRRTKGTSEAVEQIIKHAKKEPEKKESEHSWIDPYYLIPTGSTLLNCALSDHYQGGYQIGSVVNTIGDSGTGKTLLALNSLAEMTLYKRFDDYRFIFDDVELIVTEGLKSIPVESDFYKCINDVIDWYHEYPDDWKRTWFEVEKKWSSDIGCPDGVFTSFNIDAKLNAAYIIIGMLYGKGIS